MLTTARYLSIRRHINPDHNFLLSFFKIYFNIILPPASRSCKGTFFFGFPHKKSVCISVAPLRATCPAHNIIIDLITRTIFGEQYTSQSSPLCSLLQSPVTSSLFGSNIPFTTLFSHTLSISCSHTVRDQVSPKSPTERTFPN